MKDNFFYISFIATLLLAAAWLNSFGDDEPLPLSPHPETAVIYSDNPCNNPPPAPGPITETTDAVQEE